MVAENVAWVAGILGGSFPDIRCLGRGTSLGGNGDDDERESVFWGGRRVRKEGVGKDGSIEVITGVCLPCFVDVELGGGSRLWQQMPGMVVPVLRVLPVALSPFPHSRAPFGP